MGYAIFFRDVHDWELDAFWSFMDSIYSNLVRGLGRIRGADYLIRVRGLWLVHIVINFSLGSRGFLLEWLSLYGLLPWGNV